MTIIEKMKLFFTTDDGILALFLLISSIWLLYKLFFSKDDNVMRSL